MENLTIGSKGLRVRDLQRALNANGAKLSADGWFGDATEAAVIVYQRKNGLVADGIVGEKTEASLLGRATPRLLSEADLSAAALRLDVPVASIKAVNLVESAGSGFLRDGRPIIQFERHVMFRRLVQAGIDAASLAARYPQLINAVRGGYASGSAEWLQLENAAQISGQRGIANESASWGAFQIMGYHWQALNYASIDEFVTAMKHSEAQQLDAFIRFIEGDANLLKILRAKKWADFARIYNGPAYKDNLYDVKLARAFEKFSKVAV